MADVTSAYNMILGRSGLNDLQAIPITYHIVMKFPMDNEVGEVQGDLRSAREFYMVSIRVVRDAIVSKEKEGKSLA